MSSLQIDKADFHYSSIIGTGGIGSGKFFKIKGNRTIGREESRSGYFEDVKDYCKQHIILHYLKILLGPSFSVLPIGKVGDDDIGKSLIQQMKDTGFILDHVEKVKGMSTLFSFCFHYPDGSGGNLTTSNSASSAVDASFINRAENSIKKQGHRGMVLAVPEVPLRARQRILELGKKHNSFCTASFTAEEIKLAIELDMMANVDLLAINLEEAAGIIEKSSVYIEAESIVEHAIKKLLFYNKSLKVSITTGKDGSWCWDGLTLNHYAAINVNAKSTAGAGDAFFSGLLCGVVTGLTFYESQELATLIASLSVTSPHTIHNGLNRNLLFEFIQNSNIECSDKVIKLLKK